MIVHKNKDKETNNKPKLFPKNLDKIVPVYPSIADMSNFMRIIILSESIGLNIIMGMVSLSSGYSF